MYLVEGGADGVVGTGEQLAVGAAEESWLLGFPAGLFGLFEGFAGGVALCGELGEAGPGFGERPSGVGVVGGAAAVLVDLGSAVGASGGVYPPAGFFERVLEGSDVDDRRVGSVAVGFGGGALVGGPM